MDAAIEIAVEWQIGVCVGVVFALKCEPNLPKILLSTTALLHHSLTAKQEDLFNLCPSVAKYKNCKCTKKEGK